MTVNTRSVVIGIIVPLVIAFVGLVVIVVSLPDLPSPVAVHWGPNGAADQFGSPIGWLIFIAVVAIAWAAFAFFVSRPLPGRTGLTFNQRLVLAVGPFLVGLITVLMAGSVLVQRGIADARSGPSIVPVLVTAIVAAIALGTVAWFVLPRHAAHVDAATPVPQSLDLAATERAVWTQHLQVARAAALVLCGILVVALVGAGTVLWFVAPFWVFLVWVVLFALLIVGVVGTLSWRVTVDERGFLARSVFGYPRFVIPTDRVLSARTVTTSAIRDFGGYGIRWAGRGRFGVITRSGEALEITRHNGSSLTVTVAHADVAARLLNSFVERARAAKPAGSS
ncbi:MAG: hypothetical protein JWP19_2276 [Rhodoglobus sp.]|nr:hypothetical protein [Rhodoglobus sp.]